MRTGVQFPPAPPLLKPQLFSVGAFFRLMATVPACLREFLRKPADFAGRPAGSFPANFRSLHASLLSGLALRQRPEVRRGSVRHPFKSTGYARTVQAVGLRHCLPRGHKVVGGSNQIPPDASARLKPSVAIGPALVGRALFIDAFRVHLELCPEVACQQGVQSNRYSGRFYYAKAVTAAR